MGLPGSGKTTLAAALTAQLFFETKVLWLNADTIREKYNDWDFSVEGRLRQATRMRQLADDSSNTDYVIIDMVCPLSIMRSIIEPDYTVWMNTIDMGIYDDTNKMFTEPIDYQCRVDKFCDVGNLSDFLAQEITKGK